MITSTAEPPCTVDDVSSGGDLAVNLVGSIKLPAYLEFLRIIHANCRIKRSSNIVVDYQLLLQLVYKTNKILNGRERCIE